MTYLESINNITTFIEIVINIFTVLICIYGLYEIDKSAMERSFLANAIVFILMIWNIRMLVLNILLLMMGLQK